MPPSSIQSFSQTVSAFGLSESLRHINDSPNVLAASIDRSGQPTYSQREPVMLGAFGGRLTTGPEASTSAQPLLSIIEWGDPSFGHRWQLAPEHLAPGSHIIIYHERRKLYIRWMGQDAQLGSCVFDMWSEEGAPVPYIVDDGNLLHDSEPRILHERSSLVLTPISRNMSGGWDIDRRVVHRSSASTSALAGTLNLSSFNSAEPASQAPDDSEERAR